MALTNKPLLAANLHERLVWGEHTARTVHVPDAREHGNHLHTSHRSSDGPSLHSSRRVAFASLIGTTIEWYDFFIFGTAAALIFNEVFFPSFDPVTGTLAAFASFSVGFIARPFGGAVFAHYGDKIGRKPMLVYSLLLMGAATVLMGLLPGYASIGIWAPILLVALRFV
jgi:hypothetical protein